jgi:hypothetical protein
MCEKGNTNLSCLHRGGLAVWKSLLLVLSKDITHVPCFFLRIPSLKDMTRVVATVAVFTVHRERKCIPLRQYAVYVKYERKRGEKSHYVYAK